MDQIAEVHRNALEVLKKVADCCCKEAAAWTANVQALAKAKQEEEKAIARENQKEEKRTAQAERKKQEKSLKEAKAKAEKEEKKRMAAEGGGDQADVEEAEAKSKKTRNRNRSGLQELTEDDPELLHAIAKLPLGAMAVATDVPSFVDQIAEVPGAACIARLRRGPLKKVLSDSWLVVVGLFFFSVVLSRGPGEWNQVESWIKMLLTDSLNQSSYSHAHYRL